MLRMPIVLLTIGALCISPVAFQSNDNEKAIEVQEEQVITKEGHSLFEGKWKYLYSDIDVNDIEFKEEYKISLDNRKDWSFQNNGQMLYYDKNLFTLAVDNGIPKLLYNFKGNCYVYVHEEDYDKLYNEMFVSVELTSDNISEYIGQPLRIGETVDEWGEHNGYLFQLSSPALEKGLILYQYDENLQYEIIFNDGYTSTAYYPYIGLWSDREETYIGGFGRAKGKLIYVKSNYVDNVEMYYKNSYLRRIIHFKDGSSIESCSPMVDFLNENACY